MTYSHIFIDFDETLFHHAQYVEWADDVLVSAYDMAPGTYRGSFESYHQQLDDPHLRLFDHDGHALKATGRRWSAVSGELERARRSEDDFCYTDAHDFLEWVVAQPVDARILTFGAGEYQRYKLATCSKLRSLLIPVHVVDEPKRTFLAREFGQIARGVLIDDKGPLGLAKPWSELWITRQEPVVSPVQLSPHRAQIQSLGQARHYIENN